MRKRGAGIGIEAKGKGVHVSLGPMMNLGRAPEAGRSWEGSYESFLTGVAAYEGIMGMQEHVMASAKHLINNEQEHYRGNSFFCFTATFTDRVDDSRRIWCYWIFFKRRRSNSARVISLAVCRVGSSERCIDYVLVQQDQSNSSLRKFLFTQQSNQGRGAIVSRIHCV